MGYTHYWITFPRTAQFRAAWPAIVADSCAITAEVARRGITLRGPHGTGAPVTGPDRICLNGPASDGDDGWGEAFDLTADPRHVHYQPPGLPRGAVWSFCKTGRNPYDLAVTAILLRASQHAPRHVRLCSDGSWDTDWLPARDLICALFGASTPATPLGRGFPPA
jgi:hypothetical protein